MLLVFLDLKTQIAKKYEEIKFMYEEAKKEIRNDKNNPYGIIYNHLNFESSKYDTVENNNICFRYVFENNINNIKRIIYIPLFLANDEAIIHEMIHSIMWKPIEVCNNELKVKVGLCVNKITFDEREKLLEECITEIEAQIIYEKIRNKASLIDKYYPSNKFDSAYNTFINVMKSFYEKYKNKINSARLALDLDSFIDFLGRKYYDDFTYYLLQYHDEGNYEMFKDFYISMLENLLNQMGLNELKLIKVKKY